MKPIVLDRDGVINQESDHYIKSPEEWIPLPGSLEAIASLSHAGFQVIVATNQSGVARGYFDLETLIRIHNRMQQQAQEAGGLIEAVFFAPVLDAAHPARKPNPGMLAELARRLRLDLRGVPIVGDSRRDLEAARAVEGRPILVRTGRGARTEAQGGLVPGTEVFDDLLAVARHLIAGND